jgi:hypothetical protein
MRIERSIDVHTTPVKAYKVLSDPTNIPRYMPDIEDVTVTSITPRLIGTKIRMRTREHLEYDGEVIDADQGRSCAFRTSNGRTISWDIQSSSGAVRLVNTFETDEELDESRIVPEFERKLRMLRSAFQRTNGR